ncbi:hypothetical protein ACJIZ3_009628 [Penstemon smallii]|uniref:Snurportin-1 n=1 Tax=Penstemon smallii TaxID=265156 RepID=A0ABD3TEZ5_9LAMI
MAPPDLRRPFKRASISDQQRRRDLSLQRQSQNRLHAQHQSRLAHTILSLTADQPVTESEPEFELEIEPEHEEQTPRDVQEAVKLRGPEARRWFAKQLMLPEWMIDVPERLNTDWYLLILTFHYISCFRYVFARPSGKRCFVVSSNGTTVSRLRNGSMLHRFPSALPNGARTKSSSRSGQSYCILDCIFHELDQTYYVIDLLSWAGMSLYECAAEFRFFWLNSKLVETGACNDPSTYHRYRFSTVLVYNCDHDGLKAAYTGSVPYVKDGLLFYNKYATRWFQALHAHYQPGNTPLVLVWKDENCSQYVVDTDGKGQVPDQQQVVLELLDDGRLATSDDPPVIFGCLNKDFIQQVR